MTGLARHQRDFMAALLDDDAALPANWSARHDAGLAVYRNNYRSSLVEAMRATFERTERMVGEVAFDRAAVHHVITRPPDSWTIDVVGEGFDETCAALFTGHPEVAELVWLEWAMHRAFVASDAKPLTASDFAAATAHFTETDWSRFRLEFMPGLAVRPIRHDLRALWMALDAAGPTVAPSIEEPSHVIVWREDERPAFIIVPSLQGTTIEAMLCGLCYSGAYDLVVNDHDETKAIELMGAMLGRWLSEGIVKAVLT